MRDDGTYWWYSVFFLLVYAFWVFGRIWLFGDFCLAEGSFSFLCGERMSLKFIRMFFKDLIIVSSGNRSIFTYVSVDRCSKHWSM